MTQLKAVCYLNILFVSKLMLFETEKENNNLAILDKHRLHWYGVFVTMRQIKLALLFKNL